jgi:hypothetical protein
MREIGLKPGQREIDQYYTGRLCVRFLNLTASLRPYTE